MSSGIELLDAYIYTSSILVMYLSSYERVLVAELNGGQLCQLLRAEFLVPAESLTKVRGQPFMVQEIRERIESTLRREST